MSGYAEFKESGKKPVTGDDIGPGQIGLKHLAPDLFAEIQKIKSHNHSGVNSRQISQENIGGAFSRRGFVMWSSDGTKRYIVTLDSGTDDFVVTEG